MKAVVATCLFLFAAASAASGDPLNCNLTSYRAASGLSAAVADNALSITWDGDRSQELRLRFVIASGSPIIQELAVRKRSGTWGVLATNAAPDFRVVSGLRRMSNQQMSPLRGLGV